MKVSELTFDRRHPIRETLSREQCETLLGQLPGWTMATLDGTDQLAGRFEFDDFSSALAFTNRVGELAEQYNHHPAITTEYRRVTVRWWTHTAGGVTPNDFVLARETSKVV